MFHRSRTAARILLAAVAASGWIRADVARDLAQAAESPYEIERFVETHAVFDCHPLWKAVKLTDHTGLPACEERLHAGRDCSSELISVLEPEQTIVLLRHNISGFEVYLRYVPEKSSSGGSQWRWVGHYQPKVKYFPPRARIVRFGSPDAEFVLDEKRSGVSAKQIEDLYEDLDSEIINEDFLKYDLESLKEIASGAEAPQKRRLRDFLANCGETPEKQQLRAALKTQSPPRKTQ